VIAKVSKLIIARNAAAYGWIAVSWIRLSNAAPLPKCPRNPRLPHKHHRHPKAALPHKAILCSTKAMVMATHIRNAENHFWKNCSTEYQRATQKKGRLSAALFFAFAAD